MIRLFGILGIVAILLMNSLFGQASPLKGGMAAKQVVEGGQTATFKQVFKGGERACVIVAGDHRPVVPLRLKVVDAKGNPIGEDKSGGDFCAVIWYPPRDGEYLISIDVPHIRGPEDYNQLYISLK